MFETDDANDTARLIIMQAGGTGPELKLSAFFSAMRKEHMLTTLETAHYWEKYVGNRDHYRPPTHDYITGERF